MNETETRPFHFEVVEESDDQYVIEVKKKITNRIWRRASLPTNCFQSENIRFAVFRRKDVPKKKIYLLPT